MTSSSVRSVRRYMSLGCDDQLCWWTAAESRPLSVNLLWFSSRFALSVFQVPFEALLNHLTGYWAVRQEEARLCRWNVWRVFRPVEILKGRLSEMHFAEGPWTLQWNSRGLAHPLQKLHRSAWRFSITAWSLAAITWSPAASLELSQWLINQLKDDVGLTAGGKAAVSGVSWILLIRPFIQEELRNMLLWESNLWPAALH